MSRHPITLVLAGAFAVTVIAGAAAMSRGPRLVTALELRAQAALADAGASGVAVSFRTPQGWLTRHPVLSGGDLLDDATRTRAAQAVAALRGVGGVHWQPRVSGRRISAEEQAAAPLHCQEEVETVLKVRSIRFAEASAAIDPASGEVLDEVAGALRPCVGSIIAVIGHTDSAGIEAENRALSRQRANAVRYALVARGIPADGLRARGKGSAEPLAGLDAADPANRRIEFSVIETVPLQPTPIDTPGPG